MVWFLGQEDALEKGMEIHASILAWRIQWTEEPGWLQFIGSQRVGHNWSNLAHTHTWTHTGPVSQWDPTGCQSGTFTSGFSDAAQSASAPPTSLQPSLKCSHTLDYREYIKIRLEYPSVYSLKLNYEAEVSFPSTRVPSPPLQSEVSL